MPRQTFDIKEFKYGVISALDEEDIPSESASDNLNVDGDSAEGILRGIPYDTELLVDTDFDGTADDSIGNIRLGEFIEENGIYDLIYHDQDANTICVIADFYGTPKKITLISSLTSDNITMVRNNKEVHIGIDGTYGYWVGKVGHGQFSGSTSWSISDATNTSPIVVTATGHTLGNGDLVKISGVLGNTNANGVWKVANVNYTNNTFELEDSVGNAAYSAGTDTAELYMIYEYTQCDKFTGTSAGEFSLSVGSENNADGYFQNGIYYKWALSLIYDGYQESPLGTAVSDVAGAESNYYPITITADSAVLSGTTTNPFNKRITGVNLYRADSSDGTPGGAGLFRLVGSIDINNTNWTTPVNDAVIVIYDYGTYFSYSVGGAATPSNPVTYTENTGMPEVLSNPRLYYALSASGNGYHFVGKCTQPEIAGSETRRVFRSKYLRYDMFDYYTDFLEVPEPITAMHFYDGKLWIFSLNKAYRINPDGLYIEDIFDDAGCQGQRAVHSNEYGMFFGNSLNAWMYNGQFHKIGDAIRQSMSGGKSWATFGFSTLTHLIVTSDSKKGYVLFINERSDTGNKIFCWAYHPMKKRWDAWSFGGYASDADAGIFKGREGEVYLSIASNTYKLLRSSNTTYTRAWEWYSQELTFGETRQNKSLTMIKVDATGTVSITYGVDGATPATSGTSDALINTYAKSLRIKLNANAVATGTAFTNYVDSLEIIYRPLVGAR